MERIAYHVEEVRRFVAQRIANPADAEDLTQQTMLVACEKLDTFRNGSLKSWLFSIARNLVVDHYRRQGRFQFLEVETVALSEQEGALQTGREEVPDLCDSRDRLRCFLCVTGRLRLEEQVAVLLADLLGYRDKDSALAMGISLPSFKLLLHHARAHLKAANGGACALVDSAKPREHETCPGESAPGENGAWARKALANPLPWFRRQAAPGACPSAPARCSGKNCGERTCPPGQACGGWTCGSASERGGVLSSLGALRDRLIGELHTGLLNRALLAIGLAVEIPDLILALPLM